MAKPKSKFTGEIIVKLLSENFWELAEEMEYHVGSFPSDEIIKIPIGFRTDFASVPRLFWGILPPVGKYAKAAVLHDYICFERMYSRKKCDDIFLEAMKVLKVKRPIRNIMYWAVRIFGWWAWYFGRNKINGYEPNRWRVLWNMIKFW